MAEERKQILRASGKRPFAGSHCVEVEYFIETSPDKFDGERFATSLGGKLAKRSSFFDCLPRNKQADYHLHARWRLHESEIQMRVHYVSGSGDVAAGAKAPFADEFMKWAGQFFSIERIHVHVHAEFVFPSGIRESRFPLPLKASAIGPKESPAEIDGISLRLPSEPSGVSKVWVTRGKESLCVQLTANKSLTFKGFDVQNDINAFAAVLETVVEEKRS